ncbi:hypothetical protein [Candidatus Poriferisocius sp.]|uniref:hypothetical protein n=1 Tax=Candidatus Poriferisocius sp. TaxID=3101276 RepID=UPI003B5240F6
MMSYELFSLASDLRRQAAACERVRADVDPIWRSLDHLLDQPMAKHGPAVWQSAAAEGSRMRLHHQRTHLTRLRYEIERMARRLQARADELYADAARVELAADAARRREARELGLQASYFQ